MVRGESTFLLAALAAVAILTWPGSLGASPRNSDGGQDRTAELRSRFDREKDAVRKSKLITELGEAQFAEIRTKVRDGQFAEALSTLEQYRAEVQACEKALAGSGIDAEKHPNGFKQLEISLRESMRRLNEMLHSISSVEQQPFLDIHKELIEMDQRLVHQLFPKRP